LAADAGQNQAAGREEMSKSIKSLADSILARMTEIATLQKNQLDVFGASLNTLTASNEQKLEQLRATVEGKLGELQADNSQKLEQMRATVDEKLHATLEQRLGESFKIVSERLDVVSQGLGEMKTLASGVGDLKKVLTNIKTRGSFGEMQLGNLLEDLLTTEQYGANVAPNPQSQHRVEYAIKLPGKDTVGKCVWLPIDAKFPQSAYEHLLAAEENGDLAGMEEARCALEGRLRNEARTIREKYICPPHTVDFAIMFLPTEGLFAEALKRPGLCDDIRREDRVIITGPTTLAAVLSSLQMGFRTLAIEKRSSEVWEVLGAVKTEFGRFGDVLDKVGKKLQEASNTVDKATQQSRKVAKKLRDVQGLPTHEPSRLLDTSQTPPAALNGEADLLLD
jgi:DNA recombination protein RmuC